MFPSLLRIENFQNHFNIKFPIHTFGEIWAIKKRLVWRDDFKNVVIFTWSHIWRNVHQVLLWINCECIFGERNGTFPILSVASLKFEHALTNLALHYKPLIPCDICSPLLNKVTLHVTWHISKYPFSFSSSPLLWLQLVKLSFTSFDGGLKGGLIAANLRLDLMAWCC